jgi:hypothetical protein
LASIDAPAGTNPLTQLNAFKEFTASIRDRCDEPPVTTKLQRVAAFNFPA